ncbi:MAG: phosphate acyltransferase PlsX, partial [Chloroflexota bacterium]
VYQFQHQRSKPYYNLPETNVKLLGLPGECPHQGEKIMRIALDAMGSDKHPEPEVKAAVEAARKFGDEIILVGNESILNHLLEKENKSNAPVKIVHAPEVFEMTDKISRGALRKTQNSIGVGMDLLKNKEVDALISAGNTAGIMAFGLTRLGRIRGVKRPAICGIFPVRGGYCVVSDIGANVDSKPEYLLQYAIMSAAYAKTALGKEFPRVGLFSNGEEPGKGNQLVRETYPLLEASDLNFVGNIEGKELYGGEVDVAIGDGFTGNVVLKVSEAVLKFMTDILREELMRSPLTKLGALLAKPAFSALKKTIDPTDIATFPLLGVDGLVFIAHGRSNAHILGNAINRTREAVDANLMNLLRDSIAEDIAN